MGDGTQGEVGPPAASLSPEQIDSATVKPASSSPPPTKSEKRRRTAVVVVHGMGEQKPLDTVNSFIQTALWPIREDDDEPRERIYYSRPTLLTDSFEARVLVAIERRKGTPKSQTQADFYEYHWSYRMAGNTISDLVPLVRRLLLRLPWNVPRSLLFIWTLLWLTLIALGIYVVAAAPAELRSDFSIKALTDALFPHALVAGLVAFAILAVSAWLTTSFVDVARYLDTSPRSYEIRQSIRRGMVDLLASIQDSGRYERIVVVAHSLGAYIAYDAIQSLWTSQTKRAGIEFSSLESLQKAANSLPAADSTIRPAHREITRYQAAQRAVFREMQEKELAWLITDFITVGTPMAFADILLTPSRRHFDLLRKRTELPQCPPRSDEETVEGPTPPTVYYGWRKQRRLVTGSPFAVVRWTNLWFPAQLGFFGDWFGGPLRPLFGSGILDIKVKGNKFGRLLPGGAHSRYFSYPEDTGAKDVARYLRKALALDTHAAKNAVAPGADDRGQGAASNASVISDS